MSETGSSFVLGWCKVLGKVGQRRRAGVGCGMGQQRLRLTTIVSELNAIALNGRGSRDNQMQHNSRRLSTMTYTQSHHDHWLCIGLPLPILIPILPAVMRVSMLRRTAALIFSKNTRRASVRYESQIETNKAYSSMPNATNCTMRKSNHHTAFKKTSSSRKAA